MYRVESSDRSVVVAAFLGQVFGLDTATGKVRWEHAFPKSDGRREE